MARYIDADKFLRSMITKFKCVPLLGVSKYINGEEYFEGEHLNLLINETPTADVQEVRHGRWISNGLPGYKWSCHCSECGWIDKYPFHDPYKYCPDCGAEMDRMI